MRSLAGKSIIAIIFLVSLISAQTHIEVGPVRIGEIEGKAFHIEKNGKINISGYNSEYDNYSNYTCYGWIIDSKTREVIWHSLEDVGTDEDGVYRFDDDVFFKAGDYEIYYTGIRGNFNNNYSFGDLLGDIFGSKKKRNYRKNKDKLKIRIEGNEDIFQIRDLDEMIDKYAGNSIISINRSGDDESYKKRFNLKKATDIRVYFLGEGRNREFFDYAWIYDLDKRKKAWSVDFRDADHAGGARKNLMVDDTFTLPAGNYELHYVSDDTHSFDEWNELPPSDPYFYGVTLWPVKKRDLANIGEVKLTNLVKPVIELNKIGDNELVDAGFQIKKESDIRILCVGEQGYSRDMVDYGWIIDADTKEIVWEMKREDTEYAGGAKKNRMIDEVFTIDPGNYIVYFVTDDSHSYRRWNDTRPYEPENWGITIWPDKKSDYKNIKKFNPEDYKSDKVLVEILRVRSDKYLSKKFNLDKTTDVRIIAIGEGERREMFDYAWIENLDNGRIVWEMTYRKTDHAGGGKKNRIFNGVITLKKGHYKVFYESDDTHAYRDWNVSPPRNPESYGVTILKEK